MNGSFSAIAIEENSADAARDNIAASSEDRHELARESAFMREVQELPREKAEAGDHGQNARTTAEQS